MKTNPARRLVTAVAFGALAFTTTFAEAADQLPSWNHGKTKQAIINFVAKVSKKSPPDFVPPDKRTTGGIAIVDKEALKKSS